MSDKSNEEKVAETTEAVETEKSQKSCSSSSLCGPHTSFYLSVIAIVLAAYAAVSVGQTPVPANAEARLSGLESSIQGLNDQVASLGKDVESNRDNLIQNQLKKALLNIQEVSGLAKEETKATIAEVEKILSALTSPVEPEAPVSESEAAPAEEPAAEAAPEATSEAPAEAAPVEADAPAAEVEAPAVEVEVPAVEAPQPEAVAPAMPEAQAF
ncbi:hypothetical protein Ga0123461_0373 [Mariprofundus aestuarium]|uniref:Uncharacterized protein n=1 Tax=Mariprofundus aestuarium TaxID=1921086 RepID=A0A2K8KVH5_MARES|nr:hypothetical protein [Mariprofundus aestuarium]ATX78825.1 hypothetical protein Ga0123461_0373 [Mariprofundus aestuarium]